MTVGIVHMGLMECSVDGDRYCHHQDAADERRKKKTYLLSHGRWVVDCGRPNEGVLTYRCIGKGGCASLPWSMMVAVGDTGVDSCTSCVVNIVNAEGGREHCKCRQR